MTTNIFDMADTWNNGATTFTAIKMDVTDTASDAASLLMDLQVGSTSRFNVTKAGKIKFYGPVKGLLATIEQRADENNGTQDAIYLVPEENSCRIYLGDATNRAFSLNLSHSINGIEGLTALNLGGQLLWSGTSFGINRIGDGYIQFNGGGSTAGGTGFRFFTNKAEDGFTANDLVIAITGPGSLQGYNAFTDASNYERWAINLGSGVFEFAAETAGTGTDNIDLKFTPAGTGLVQFGTRTAIGAETITGYITIKDSGGTTRLLAVVSA